MKADKKSVTVTLTVKEAEALLLAAGQTLGHSDACDATFSDGRERNAAFRGHDKIQAAIHEDDTVWVEKI